MDFISSELALDKTSKVCYNKQCQGKDIKTIPRAGGEIGKHTGLKILRPGTVMRVRLPLGALEAGSVSEEKSS